MLSVAAVITFHRMALHPCPSMLCYSYRAEITSGDDLGVLLHNYTTHYYTWSCAEGTGGTIQVVMDLGSRQFHDKDGSAPRGTREVTFRRSDRVGGDRPGWA